MSDSLMPRVPVECGIPLLSGRPARAHDIDQDDILNLKITLGLHQDVDDVCRDPHLFTTEKGER